MSDQRAIIVEAHDPQWLPAVAAIFAEYAASISSHCASLNQQRFDAELAGLPGLYAPPAGRLYLAIDPAGGSALTPSTAAVAGCAALRPLPATDPRIGPGCAEVKRMYVRPQFRRRGLAQGLCERLIADAAAIGYRRLKLDTGDDFHAAIALYESLGFRRCERYNDDPQANTLWFERELMAGASGCG